MADTRIKNPGGSHVEATGDYEGRQFVVVGGTPKRYFTEGAGAISYTTQCITDYPGRPKRLLALIITWSAAPTTSEDVTLTLAAIGSTRPEPTVLSYDPSVRSATSLIQTWDPGYPLSAADELTLAYANTDVGTVKAEIVMEIL